MKHIFQTFPTLLPLISRKFTTLSTADQITRQLALAKVKIHSRHHHRATTTRKWAIIYSKHDGKHPLPEPASAATPRITTLIWVCTEGSECGFLCPESGEMFANLPTNPTSFTFPQHWVAALAVTYIPGSRSWECCCWDVSPLTECCTGKFVVVETEWISSGLLKAR